MVSCLVEGARSARRAAPALLVSLLLCPGCYALGGGLGEGMAALLLVAEIGLGVLGVLLAGLALVLARRRRRIAFVPGALAGLLFALVAFLVIGSIEPPRPTAPVVEVAPGDGYACARLSDGSVLCADEHFGNSRGQLGTGDTSERIDGRAIRVSGADPAVRLWLSDPITCAERRDGEVLCWGELDGAPSTPRSFGRPRAVAVGDETLWLEGRTGWVSHPAREDVPADATVAGYASCRGTRCVRYRDGHVACTHAGSAVFEPLPLISGASDLAVAGSRACAVVRAGRVLCWDSAQRTHGIEMQETVVSPPLDGVQGAVELAAGDRHFCARIRDGTVSCWGDNDLCQLGVGDRLERKQVVAVAGVQGAERLHAGPASTCASLRGGSVMCWGREVAGVHIDSPAVETNAGLARTWLGARRCHLRAGVVTLR